MIQFYKPNSRNTGSACSFWLNRDGSAMASLIKQSSWDDKRKIGSFSKNKDNPKGRVIIKLSRTEVAAIIDSVESNREFSTYHRSQKQVLQIRFSPYMDKNNNSQKGFSFGVNKQEVDDSTVKTSFVIGFTFPEARLLRHDLESFLDKTMNVKDTISVSEREEEPVQAPQPPQPSQQQAVEDSVDEGEPW